MVVERDEFFAELDGLTEKEIEARLDLWDRESCTDSGHQIRRVMGRPAEPAAGITAAPAQDDAAMASGGIASTANTKATAALILSAVMLAAIASALGLLACEADDFVTGLPFQVRIRA
jgi:hypothetical protein